MTAAANATRAEGKIKPIDRAAVHRICSGQVVLDLATAVKELVENSLDAGATSIDIRLKDHGAELIEVADNGTGVSPDNYEGLTLKYHTSKISRFADLQSLSSFGFRGEALSSLCALAKLSIITRTKDEPVAVRLEYDHSGKITSQENVARAVGTTVSVAKLFSPLPVRFKEFRRENNLRREYGRLLSLLQAYALIAKGVRIICSHQVGKGARNVVVQTQGNTSLRDNLVTVFGTKTASCMEQLDLLVSDTCSVEGFVSKPGAGSGRPSGDRQFFYVNGRPVDLPKVSKLLNELYRSFNSLQFPMAVLNFILPTSAYDVNVTPDKRKLFLHSENELLGALRGSLEKVYTPTKYTYALNSLESGRLSQKGSSSDKLGKQSNIYLPFLPDAPTDACSDDEEAAEKEECLAHTSGGAIETDVSVSGKAPVSLEAFQHTVTNDCTETGSASASREKNVPNPLSGKKEIQATLVPCTSRAKRPVEESRGVFSEVPLLKRWRQLGSTKKVEDEDEDEDGNEEVHDMHENDGAKSDTLDDGGLDTSTGCHKESCTEEDEIMLPPEGEQGLDAIPASTAAQKVRNMVPCSNGKLNKGSLFRSSREIEEDNETEQLGHKGVKEGRQAQEPDTCCAGPVKVSGKNVNPVRRERLAAVSNSRKKVVQTEEPVEENVEERRSEDDVVETEVTSTEQVTPSPPQQREVIQIDLEKLQRKLNLGLQRAHTNSSSGKHLPRRKSGYAAATLSAVGEGDTEKEDALKAATKELERRFNKSDYRRMKVLGQFNLGFILAKIDDDIFIVDQHASDEKYNFERLSKTTVLNRQPLLRPSPLELTAAEEMTVISHMETFRQNGFDFVEKEEAPAGQRLQLSAVPFSQNVTFGIGDVQELIALLANEPVTLPSQKASSWLPRPSRVRAMLASRACRTSVMIGDPLSKTQMERILSHLAELDAPWNCPHGRPTMRHLLDLRPEVQVKAGDIIDIYWVVHTKWFRGLVRDVDPWTGKWEVHYDDGDIYEHDLTKLQYHTISSPGGEKLRDTVAKAGGHGEPSDEDDQVSEIVKLTTEIDSVPDPKAIQMGAAKKSNPSGTSSQDPVIPSTSESDDEDTTQDSIGDHADRASQDLAVEVEGRLKRKRSAKEELPDLNFPSPDAAWLELSLCSTYDGPQAAGPGFEVCASTAAS
ncbi:unnamed protein product [Calypogeia fissa]